MQRRALWIALAFLLQAGIEIPYSAVIPFGAVIPLLLTAGSFYAMWKAFRPARTKAEQAYYTRPTQLRQRIMLMITVVLALVGIVFFLGRGIAMSILPPQFSNDGTSLDTNAAILLTQGRNPYTDSNMLDLARRFPIQPNWTTPLRQGQFEGRLDYPSMAEFQSVLDTDLKAGTAPEFESKVSYPALSFLTLVPFAIFKSYNVLPFYILCYLLLVAIAYRSIRQELRPWVLLLGIANIPMWASTVGGNLDIFYTLLLMLVWLKRDNRLHSAIFLGLAIASKQIAWFFIPFYVIMVWQHYGFKDVIYRMTIASALALVINLPFILWNPGAFFAGVMAPVADPMFPLGVGIISLNLAHLLPFFPSFVYTGLEGLAMLGALIWYWRNCRKHPESAMLLAVLPLFFAWRSLPSYFYCIAYPLFILLATRLKPQVQPASQVTAIQQQIPALELRAPVRV